MGEIDPDLRDKIVETHTDMKHVRRTLQEHDDGIEELRNQHDERLRCLEQNQSKIMTYIVALGSAITVIVNGVLYMVGKLWK